MRKRKPQTGDSARISEIIAAMDRAERDVLGKPADQRENFSDENRARELSEHMEFLKMKMFHSLPSSMDDAAALVCVISGECDLLALGLWDEKSEREKQEREMRIQFALYNLRAFLEKQGASVPERVKDYFMRDALNPNNLETAA